MQRSRHFVTIVHGQLLIIHYSYPTVCGSLSMSFHMYLQVPYNVLKHVSILCTGSPAICVLDLLTSCLVTSGSPIHYISDIVHLL